MKKIKLVTIGGGKGQACVLKGLMKYDDLEITSIVSMSDSGGGSGVLRDEMGVLPPGDVLKNLLALSPYSEKIEWFLQTRFQTKNNLNGNSPGNFLLASLFQYSGNCYESIKSLAEILGVRGEVLPVTENKTTLVALLKDGEKIIGEDKIDVLGDEQRSLIENLIIKSDKKGKEIFPGKNVIERIKNANYIILSPGDLYTSLLPNLLVPGVREALQVSSAKLIYVVNIATKKGETDNYDGKQFVRIVEKYVGRKMDIVIANKNELTKDKYLQLGVEPVGVDGDLGRIKTIRENLVSDYDIIRYDSNKLGKIIYNTIKC